MPMKRYTDTVWQQDFYNRLSRMIDIKADLVVVWKPVVGQSVIYAQCTLVNTEREGVSTPKPPTGTPSIEWSRKQKG